MTVEPEVKGSEAELSGTNSEAPAPNDGGGGTPSKRTKTPFFVAMNASRYRRQALLKELEGRLGYPVICYVTGIQTQIDRDDTIGFVDLLHNVKPDAALGLLLHTSGGDIDAAEKLITMVRTRVGSGRLSAIVPDFAKSAGTLMVLGADAVIMSDTSELGPIDPQISRADGNGNRIGHSVQTYLDAYKTHSEALAKNPDDVAAQIMLRKLDPATVKLFEAVRNRAQRFAEEQLRDGMFKKGGNYTLAAHELIDTNRWQSHGQMISWEDAKDPRIGLNVEYMHPRTAEWEQIWELYCMQRLEVGPKKKLYESASVSLVIEGET